MPGKPYKDISGQRFGRLIAVDLVAEKGKRTRWRCKCDCGGERLVPLNSLNSGKCKSCGCLRKENTSKTFKKHGLTDTRLYEIWLNMRNRCKNHKNSSFKNYGGRGIEISEEWDVFENFYKWSMENGYNDELSIDRINNDGNYEPSNCRWETREVQANNTRINVFTEVEGVTRTLSEHARHYNINYFTFHHRYHEIGLRGEDLIKPVQKKQLSIEIDGQIKSLKAWARHYGLNYRTVQHRYSKGIRGKKLFGPVDPIMSAKANKLKEMRGN
ncbi:hypothetical protein MKZ18_06485 [Priestia sp. FSL W8-0001]|uniref:hypothetical protein n=1 Tax=unclassified Priestia TaxID=2800374 RepID=UPI0030F60567